MSATTADTHVLRSMTTDIVAAYLSKNNLPPSDVPGLIITVHGAFDALARGATPTAVEEAPKPTPAEIRKSIRPDALVSFLDGKPYKTLRRHLVVHGLEPASYRVKFGLPAGYPMTAPSYSARRSALAKAAGLGQRSAA